jgi:cobyrinic acid a,c-diamide synthase
MKRQIPRLVIAGTHSGCGKTTIATGLMAALTAKGMRVQPFKVGPDFIDPTHHTEICGRISRNLDPFMMGEEGIIKTFCHATEGADIAVIEGVMGLFDGLDGTETASTAHVASILHAPVILVVDVRGMSRSAHAIIHGYRTYNPDLTISGVIFNRIGSDRHRRMIDISRSVPALGWIPRREDIAVQSRHLGLAMAHEKTSMSNSGRIISEYCDLDAVAKIALQAPPLPVMESDKVSTESIIRLGVAWDPAFCFYYRDNLDKLRSEGADLVFFSPMKDRLPDVDGIYIGGGYPELYLETLSACACRADIRKAAASGMPVYGECGGLMYLSSEISSDKSYRLCNVLPARAEMTKNIQALGYVRGETTAGSPCIPAGISFLGHEFHYSRIIPENDARYAIELQRGQGIEDKKDGLISGCTLGTYTHAYFSPEFARHFVECCADYRSS